MKRKAKLWLMVVLTLLVSVFSVLSDLIKYEGNLDFLSPWFWLNLILTNLSAISIIFLSNTTEKDLQMMKNDKYNKLTTSLDQLFTDINTHNLRQRFANYIEADNARAKYDVYVKHLKQKILRCERAIDKLARRYNMWRLFFKKPTVENPKTLFILMWRGRLSYWKSRLDNADNDYKYATVRYIRVTEDSIFGSSDEKRRASRDMSYHTAQHNFEILMKKFFTIVVFGFAAALGFTFNPVTLSVEFFYKMAIRLFQLGMALYTGISDADKFVEGDMCAALYRRIAYVQAFKESYLKQKTGGENPPVLQAKSM